MNSLMREPIVKKILFAVLMVSLMFSGKAFAVVVTFDDLTAPPTHLGYAQIGTYAGFSWSSSSYYFDTNIRSEYHKGIESAPHAAFSASGIDEVSFTSANAFNFEEAYFTSVFWNQQNLEIEGYLGTEYRDTVDIRISQTRTSYDINLNNVDQIYIYSQDSFTMDNMIVTPEPGSMVLFLLGGAPMAAALYRRKRKL
jgi:hypothetical protein